MRADEERRNAIERARTVKARYQSQLMAKANVVGVGVGFRQRAGVRTDEVVIVVMVERKVAADVLAAGDVVPPELDGVPVDVVQVGRLDAGN